MACNSDCVLGGGKLVVHISRDAYKDYPSLIIGSEWPSIPVRESSSPIHSLKTIILAATGGSLAWKLSLLSVVTFSKRVQERVAFHLVVCVLYSVSCPVVMHSLCGMTMQPRPPSRSPLSFPWRSLQVDCTLLAVALDRTWYGLKPTHTFSLPLITFVLCLHLCMWCWTVFTLHLLVHAPPLPLCNAFADHLALHCFCSIFISLLAHSSYIQKDV